MGAFGMCDNCAWRYCGVPNPQCSICLGTGRIDGGDIDGVDPLVVLRAAFMALHEKVPRIRVCEAKLLGEPGSGTHVEPPIDMASRSAVGRAAGRLLIDLGLRRTKTRKASTPEERAAKRRAREAKKEQAASYAAHFERRRQERERELRQRKVERAAQAAIAAAHPDEYEQEREAQEVFVALEEGLPDANMALHHSARRQR
jgi:hypothetical protein